MRTRHTAAVVGLGHSRVMRRAEVPLGLLAVEAVRAAADDAGIEVSAIDGVAATLGNALGIQPGMVDGREYISAEFLTGALGLRPRWGTNNTHMVGNAFADAVYAVEAGACQFAVVVRAMHNPAGKYGHTTRTEAVGSAQFAEPYGWFTPALFAHSWHRYQDKYGSGSREQMATFVVQARENGLLNPDSYWRQHRPERLTVDEYLGARMVSTPLSIYDCDLPVQGAAAFLLTTQERARDLGRPVAYVLGVASPQPAHDANETLLLLDEEEEAARHVAALLWTDSGLSPADVDLANLYDGFSFVAFEWLEGMGLAPRGEGFEFVQDGRARRTGELPLNTGGGNLGAGRMHGVPHLMDSARQVMGRGGEAQVDGVHIALAAVGPPSLGAAFLFGSQPLSS